MTDLLDMSVEAMDAPPPVATPAYLSSAFGCSEVAPLLVALDMREGLPVFVREWIEAAQARLAYGIAKKGAPLVDAVYAVKKARTVRTARGPMAECIATKAGIREKEASTWDAEEGNRLERELLTRWIATLGDDSVIVPGSIRSQHDVLDLYPSEWGVRAPRITHPKCQRLIEYPDAWCETVFGERLLVNAKCTRERKHAVSAVAWIQMQAEIACTRSDGGLLVYGQRWLADYIDGEPWQRGEIAPFRVEPDPAAEAVILAAVEKAWALVERAREERV